MPPAIPIIAGAVATAASTAAGATILGLSVASTAAIVGTVVSVAASVAISTVTKKKTKKRSVPRVSVNPGAGAAGPAPAPIATAASSATVGQPGSGSSPTPANLSPSLGVPNSLPPVRHIYGKVKIQGSPAPWRVDGRDLYGCLILNSRPSDGGDFSLRVDKENITLTGDPFDFTGPGARPSSGVLQNHLIVWIGRGDQTGPPDLVLANASSIFNPTDAWSGLTVAWVIAAAGSAATFRERWASSPPEFEFTMKWSKVWDPRDEDQDPDDPDTWTWSNNQGLVALDAETQNPKEPLQLDLIDLETYKTQADIADEEVTISTGTEKRYCANGLVLFGAGELHSTLEPIYVAGASHRIRNGGLRAVTPGRFEEPELTITDYIGPDITIETLGPSRDLVTRLRTSFANENVGYEEAELQEYEVPGATEDDGNLPTIGQLTLPMVTSPFQAMRITKITAYELRRQKTVSLVGMPETFELINGSSCAVDIPGLEFADGTYRVETILPLIFPEGENGVSLRCALELVEWSATPYAFSVSEEFTVTQGADINVEKQIVAAPANLSFASGSGENINTGGGVILPRLLVTFPPSGSSSVDSYDIEYRVNGSGDSYEVAGSASADQTDGSGDVFFYIEPVTAGESYDVRVRSVSPQFGNSSYVEELNVLVAQPSATLGPPTGASINVTGQTTLTYSANSPNDSDFDAMECYINTTNDSSTSTLAGGPTFGSPSQVLLFDITGLTAATTYYLWSRAVDSFGQRSDFSAVQTDTTNA